uniref:Uncharacterized protein n=1 Tax=Rhizophora mucronata TaxID=61149 RepID=A0A2P2JMQ0_RHIMU
MHNTWDIVLGFLKGEASEVATQEKEEELTLEPICVISLLSETKAGSETKPKAVRLQQS